MARYLRRAGHTVTIVATGAFGDLSDDAELDVVRVPDLRSARPLRALLRRGELSVVGGDPKAEEPPTALLTKVVVPDSHLLSWLPAALPTVRRLITDRKIDCFVTSSPPESVHLLGLLLGSRRPAWIADFRDGWVFEPLREPFPTGAQRAFDAWLERRVVSTADAAVGAYPAIATDLERRLDARAIYVPNAWDPEAAPTASPLKARRVGDTMTLVHTGTLWGAGGRSPEPLFRALLAVRSESGLPALRLVIAGRLTTEERELIDRSGLGKGVEYVGMLDREGALALQRSADALVLVTSPNTSSATAKIFEYLASGGRSLLWLRATKPSGSFTTPTPA